MLQTFASLAYQPPPYTYKNTGLPQQTFSLGDYQELLEHIPKKGNKKEWEDARDYRTHLRRVYRHDYLTRACLEIEAQPKYPPDYLHTTGAKRKRAAEKRMNSPKGKALLEQSKDLHYGSFHWRHIGLSEAYRYPELFFKPEVAKEVLETLTRLYDGLPFMWKMELGKDKDGELGETHVHVIGDAPKSLKHLAHEKSEILKPIKGREVVNKFRYLEKPALYFQPYSYALYLEENETKEGYRLPNLRGFKNVRRTA